MTTIQKLTDANDPRLDPYRAIRERDLVRHHKQFIAEGKSVLAVLANQQHHFEIVSILILENRLESVTDILAQFDPKIPVYSVDRTIIDTVAGFPMHRGVLATVKRPRWCDQQPLTKANHWRRVVALSQIANHDNMGAIFRNAAAFGADAVIMDAQSCDPLYRKAIRVSVGGVLKTPFAIFPDTSAMIGWLTDTGFDINALTPTGETELHQWTPRPKTALLLGAEGSGLNPDIMKDLTRLRIDIASDFDSLNVATASAIALYALRSRALTS